MGGPDLNSHSLPPRLSIHEYNYLVVTTTAERPVQQHRILLATVQTFPQHPTDSELVKGVCSSLMEIHQQLALDEDSHTHHNVH